MKTLCVKMAGLVVYFVGFRPIRCRVKKKPKLLLQLLVTFSLEALVLLHILQKVHEIPESHQKHKVILHNVIECEPAAGSGD